MNNYHSFLLNIFFCLFYQSFYNFKKKYTINKEKNKKLKEINIIKLKIIKN